MMATALLRGLLRREVQTEQQINPLLQRCKDHIDLMAFQKYPSLYTDNTKPTPIPFLRMNYGVGSRSELSRLLSAETLEELQLDDKRQSGEVWRCLAAGIFSLRTAMVRLEDASGQNCEELRKTLFEELITDLIFQGGDAQANATFAGALLGAYLGYDAIPEQWREGLRYKNFLMRKSKMLCLMARAVEGRYNNEPDSKLYPARSELGRRYILTRTTNRRAARLDMLRQRRRDAS